MIKKFILAAVLLAVSIPAFSQKTQNASTRWKDIQMLHFESETADLEKLQPIYSKARGVTIFAAINNVNNRALRKLKVEAAMMGADAVYITNNYQKGVQFYAPVQVAYSAIPYVREPLTVQRVQEMTKGREYIAQTRTRYNRNAFSESVKLLIMPDSRISLAEAYEERGHVFVDLTLENYKRPYRVVRVTDRQVVLARVLEEGKIIENFDLVEVQERNRE